MVSARRGRVVGKHIAALKLGVEGQAVQVWVKSRVAT